MRRRKNERERERDKDSCLSRSQPCGTDRWVLWAWVLVARSLSVTRCRSAGSASSKSNRLYSTMYIHLGVLQRKRRDRASKLSVEKDTWCSLLCFAVLHQYVTPLTISHTLFSIYGTPASISDVTYIFTWITFLSRDRLRKVASCAASFPWVRKGEVEEEREWGNKTGGSTLRGGGPSEWVPPLGENNLRVSSRLCLMRSYLGFNGE